MKGRSFIAVLILGGLVAGCKSSSPAVSTTGGKSPDPVTDASKLKELKIETLVPGKGEGAEIGDVLTMLYRGTLANGTLFDGNMDEKNVPSPTKEPFSLYLGGGSVIQGWDKGLVGIKVGEIRKLSIPSELGYGAAEQNGIPANSDLYFNVKCLDIVRKGEEMVIDTTDVKVGTGPAVKIGDKIAVHYVGKLLNGKQFDSSRERGQTFSFTVGKGEVVPGFDKGVQGMKKGGVRKLRIPPQAAYGADPRNGIPANSVLLFEIEIVKIN